MSSSRAMSFTRGVCLWIGLIAFLWIQPGPHPAFASTGDRVAETTPAAGSTATPSAIDLSEIPVAELDTSPGESAKRRGPFEAGAIQTDPITFASGVPNLASDVPDDSVAQSGPAPFYKKAWFLVAAAGVIVLTAVLAGSTGDDGRPGEMTEQLPDFPLPPNHARCSHVQKSMQ